MFIHVRLRFLPVLRVVALRVPRLVSRLLAHCRRLVLVLVLVLPLLALVLQFLKVPHRPRANHLVLQSLDQFHRQLRYLLQVLTRRARLTPQARPDRLQLVLLSANHRAPVSVPRFRHLVAPVSRNHRVLLIARVPRYLLAPAPLNRLALPNPPAPRLAQAQALRDLSRLPLVFHHLLVFRLVLQLPEANLLAHRYLHQLRCLQVLHYRLRHLFHRVTHRRQVHSRQSLFGLVV